MDHSKQTTWLGHWIRPGLFLVVLALSVSLWLLLRRPLGVCIRAIAAPVVRAIGETPTYPSDDIRGTTAGPAPAPYLGILVSAVVRGGQLKQSTYVISLMRWHINVIVLAALVGGLGRMSLIRRMILLALTVPVLLALDGCNVALFLMLAARRMRAEALISTATHANLEYASAVIVPRILPFLVWLAAELPRWRRAPEPSRI